jgi:SAM-dependent methyltransferase
MMLVSMCGCECDVDPASGVLRALVKCAHHQRRARPPASLGRAYYCELGSLIGNTIREDNYLAELLETLGPFPAAPGLVGEALEIGCGISPYVRAIQAAGYAYTGIDSSAWAVAWMREHREGCFLARDFEDLEALEEGCWDLILAAHSLEHMKDAPGAVCKIASLLRPGGEAWIIVPDDSDPVNPDHLWYFTEATLAASIEAAGLVVLKLEARRRIPREVFLYARARRP